MGQVQSHDCQTSCNDNAISSSHPIGLSKTVHKDKKKQLNYANEVVKGRPEHGPNDKTKQISTSILSSPSNAFKKIHRKENVRKLSNVSHRNIQLLSLKPRSEHDAFVDDLKVRRRSSLINLILGNPSSGPRFCDDLCSVNSQLSNFGIEFFPDTCRPASISSINSLRFDGIGDSKTTLQGDIGGSRLYGVAGDLGQPKQISHLQKRRRSSIGSIEAVHQQCNLKESAKGARGKLVPQHERKEAITSSPLASIDLTSSYDHSDQSPTTKQTEPSLMGGMKENLNFYDCHNQVSRPVDMARPFSMAKRRINPSSRVLRRSGSELSLYSSGSSIVSSSTLSSQRSDSITSSNRAKPKDPSRETKLIIILQVCLPFMVAGFGNIGAGLVLSKVAHWDAFRRVPALIVLLPPLVGLKGNIEMTLASRLSTLSNLNLLDTKYRRRRVYLSNLILTLSQAIGLSLFASIVALVCHMSIGSTSAHQSPISNQPETLVTLPIAIHGLIVITSAIATSITLVIISSVVMSAAIAIARVIQVNPDNLSTLVAALYGDVSCVFVYGVTASWIYSMLDHEELLWPILIVTMTLASWPLLIFCAYKLKETHGIALSSIPPMITSILISMGSGTVLSLVVGRFKLIAIYQPVVNGFGANLIAVQAGRVSTWLWCTTLRKMTINSNGNSSIMMDVSEKKATIGSLASFSEPISTSTGIKNTDSHSANGEQQHNKSICSWLGRVVSTTFWSFLNPSPNSEAARLLLVMIIPAHSLYFIVIWFLSSGSSIALTWEFYLVYLALCSAQVFILLTLCEPFMTLLMNRNLDPDIFGISILMALADLTGTLCLTGAFKLLSSIGDVNASQ